MYSRQKAFLIRAAYFAALALLIWGAVRYLLGWVLPFLIALALAAAAEPAIEFCRRKMRFKRAFTAAVLTLALLSALTALVTVLLMALLRQAYDLLTDLPIQLQQLPLLLDTLEARFNSFCAACPEALRTWLDQFLQGLSESLVQLFERLSAVCLRFVTDALTKLPQAFLFCATTALAVFFTASSYPSIMAFLRRQLSGKNLQTARGVKANLYSTLGKWLRAELTLLAITFAQLLAGFLLLGQRYALLLAVLIALIDALPVFGTGTVLIPWAILCFLVDDVPRGIALVALYALIALVRSIMEPRIMAAQADLPPLVTLIAIYVGFRTLGVAGMLLLPIALLFIKQLHDAGFIRLWK